MLHAPKRTLGRADSVVAGGRHDTVCDLPMPLVLPVVGQVAKAAA